MRVVILISSYYPDIGGHEVFAREIAKRLVRDGNEVDVITGHQVDMVPETAKGQSRQFEATNGVNVYRLNQSVFSPIFFPRAVGQLVKLDKLHNYNVIHSVGEGIYAQVGTVGKLIQRKPHLITIQGGILQRGFSSTPRDRLTKPWVRWSLRMADAVHAISLNLAREAEGLGARNIEIIPNGIDEAIFKPRDKQELRQKYGFSPREKIMVCVSRLIPRKRVDSVIRATALLAREIPDLRLIVIGDGDQHQELQKLVAELYVDQRVELKGWLPQHEISDYLCLADVFVSPPDFEGLGIVFIEALACGAPVVGTSVGGIPDIIEDGRNGILVPPGDVDQLAQGIKKVLEDEELRNSFIIQGLKRVKEKFLWGSVYEKVSQIYQDLVQNSQGAGG